MDSAFSAMLKTALTSFIGRVILAAFTLVVVPVLPTLINFVNNVLGYDLTDAQVTSYAKNAAIGIAALAATWLLNRGLFERSAVQAKAVIEAGKGVTIEHSSKEHAPDEFDEPPLGSGDPDAQKAGFKSSTARAGDPTVPPGISEGQ